MTTFLLIRHAATDYAGHTLVGRRPGVHLNQQGWAQAQRLAERLAGEPLRALYSSPLERALETAAPLAERLGLRVETCEELNEVDFGDWTDRTVESLVESRAWKRYNALRGWTRIPGGESMLEMQARVVSAVERFRQRHPAEMIALFSHGDPLRVLVAQLLSTPLDLIHRLEISVGSITTVEMHDWGPVVRSVNSTDHLR